jgi:hypothetical protein
LAPFTLRSRGIDAHALGQTELSVAQEHVPVPVRVRGHEIEYWLSKAT